MKKTLIIALITFLVLTNIGTLASYGNYMTETETTQKASTDKLTSCGNQAVDLATRMLSYYNTVADYQNAGYLVDDYNAGSITAQVDKWNTDEANFNSNCTDQKPSALQG